MLNYPKICVNCINCCEGDDEFICESDDSIIPDLVRGGVLYRSCEEMRNTVTLCGRAGMFFKENEDLMDLFE